MSKEIVYYPAVFHNNGSSFDVIFPYIETRIAYGVTYEQAIIDAERVIKEHFDINGVPTVTKDMWVIKHSLGEFVSPVRYIIP